MNSAIKKIEEEDYSKVAELIYDTSTSLSEFIFGERKKNVPKIKQLVAMGNNSFSYENIRGYYLDKELVGLYVGYTGEKKSYYDGTADLYAFSRAFNIFKSLVLIFKTPVLSRLLTSNLKNNEYYISNLIVNSQFRRQGIGSFLLNHAVENARKEGCTSVILDVDMTSKEAISLYKKIGFEIIAKNEIKILKEGTYKMALNL